MTENNHQVAVIICSVGRPACVLRLAPLLADQSQKPDRVIFVVTSQQDVSADTLAYFHDVCPAEIVIAPKGLTKQRNAGLQKIAQSDQQAPAYVVFFDDDFLPSRYALEGIAVAFDQNPGVNGMTGHLIADGIHGVGLTHDEGVRLVAEHDAAAAGHVKNRPAQTLRSGLEGLYGCNMAYRYSALEGVRFDERLPLYGWQEDIDFAAQVPGQRIKTNAFKGVHLGTKGGRETAGQRLGYSQIANPYYLWCKGTMSARFAFKLMTRNFIANHAKMFRPEPWIDRTARARGNWLALRDVLLRKSDPERILSL